MNPNPRQLAFDALVRRLSPELYRFAYWLCKSRALAQDILQECYLRAWRSSEDLRDVNSAKAWMMTILRREWLVSRTEVTLSIAMIPVSNRLPRQMTPVSPDHRH